MTPDITEAITYVRASLDCLSASITSPIAAALLALLAASIAFNPNGQQQNRQERTAGTIQS